MWIYRSRMIRVRKGEIVEIIDTVFCISKARSMVRLPF